MDEQQHAASSHSSSHDPTVFPVVGIGASAGGLPALARLLEHMPPAPGMALVAVLHLAPDMPSAADRLLQRVTAMPVPQVRERVRLRPNQVYLISPGLSLRVEDGELVADEKECALGIPMTVNIFLRTLGEAYGERAIGVVLSGMGSDGVAGLACIKEHGGIAIAQLPDEAEESGMPQAAIDAGVVDVVLPAADVSAKLMELRDALQAARQRPRQGKAGSSLPSFALEKRARETLDAVLALLYLRTGHDFRHYRQPTILRRLEHRMQSRGAADLSAYFRLLQQEPQEPHALLQDLLIGMTQFFRDRDAFLALEQAVLPRLFQDREPGAPFRAWVAACSTGQEAYSIGMLLAGHAGSADGAPAMQIFATDVDERALQVARAARYPATIAAEVPAQQLARYFVREDDHFTVRRILRDRIRFARHDLLHDPAFSQLDLIACRNVLIYLNREIQRHVLEIFHGALKPGGCLFLGSAESADLASDLFAAVDARHQLYQAKPGAKAVGHPSRLPQPRAAGRQAGRAAAAPLQAQACASSFAELHQRKLAELAAPSVLVDDKGAVVHVSDQAGAFLRRSAGEPSEQVLSLVLPALRSELRVAMFQASASGAAALSGPIRYEQDGKEGVVTLSVTPVREGGAGAGMMLVQFQPGPPSAGAEAHADGAQPRVRELEEALLRTQRNLQQAIERADALQGKVEQLRANVEELEIHREEMQSRNEELITVNTELKMRIEDTSKANDDLSNLIASTDIATLFLDRELRIQRYTPHARRIFNVIPADIGRPLAHISNRLACRGLLDEVAGALADLRAIERELRSTDGRDYILRVHPYLTAYDRVEGVVLTFFDISRRRAAETALQESEQRLALAFAALPVGICTVDTSGNMVMLNEVMRRFLPTGTTLSRDPVDMRRWRAWDAAGAPVQPRDFPGARALRGESVLCGMQMLHVEDDGGETWTEVRAEPLRDGAGNITGALVVVIDVDRLKRSEEAARQGQERHAFLLELGDALRAQPDEQSIRKQAVRMLADHLRLDRCWISEVFGEQGISTVGPEHARPDLPPMSGVFQLADYPETMQQLATQPMVIEDAAADARFSPSEKALLDGLHLRALLVAPVRAGRGRVIWALASAMATARRWNDSERVLLEEAAERTWSAIERMRAERRAENILEHMGGAHSVLDRDYRIVGMNAAAERLLGRRRQELLGRSHWEAFPGSLDAPVGAAFRRVVEEGVEQHLTHHYAGEDDDLHLEVDAYPTDEGGLAMFWRDVTERVRAEQALRASEEKYRALFNEMDEAYAVVEVMADAAGRWNDFLFLEVNPAFMRHTGMPYPVGRTATELLGTPNPHWAQLYGRAAETGEPIRVEEFELTLGRAFDLNIFRLGGAESRRVAVLFTDITGRKGAEAALRESEARFRALADASPALIWRIDAGGDLDYVNGRCLELTGASLDRMRDTGWHGIVHPDDAGAYLDAVAHALQAQESVQQRVRLRKADGRHHWFASHALPWHAADGHFRGLVGISIDVNEAVQAEEALKMADRRKDEFLATLAHELRNPLAPISNALQFLRYDGGKRRADRLLAMVERQVRHMVRLVDDLMEVSRISRGKVDLRRTPVALADIINASVETSLPACEQKRQRLAIDTTDEPLTVDADKVRLTQVFANLLNNAAKYTAAEGEIRLGVRRDGRDAVVTVRDTGMGIGKEQLPFIFEMFSQPHGRNGRSDSGLGIGLAMVRSLVELHGGAVEAHSEGPGKGSEFVVRLPLADCPAAPCEAEGACASGTTLLAGRRILVVDDNRDAADSLCQVLAARGAGATAVYDGRSAIDALDAAPPDAIVLDIGMPDMDGYEVARRIRQDGRAGTIQLVALSGWGQQADRQRSRACGIDHHLTKPADLDSLLAILCAARGRAGDVAGRHAPGAGTEA